MDRLHADLKRVLVTEEAIQKRVGVLADQISKDYADAGHLHLVAVLKGAFIFLADLSRRLTIPHTVDFLAVSSYANKTTSGEVRMVMDLREPIEGKHVLIVEDIIDSGKTLKYLCGELEQRRPASLKTCSFVRKERHGHDAEMDYLGFEIPDVWVVGYGLDYAEKHRTLPFIAELKESVYAEAL